MPCGMSMLTGCGHVGRGVGSVLGKVALGLAAAAAAGAVNRSVAGPHRRAPSASADDREACAEADRAIAAAKLRVAERAYAETAAPVPTF